MVAKAPRIQVEQHLAEFYRKILTENYRMNFIWELEFLDYDMALKVRSLVKCTFVKNPRID